MNRFWACPKLRFSFIILIFRDNIHIDTQIQNPVKIKDISNSPDRDRDLYLPIEFAMPYIGFPIKRYPNRQLPLLNAYSNWYLLCGHLSRSPVTGTQIHIFPPLVHCKLLRDREAGIRQCTIELLTSSKVLTNENWSAFSRGEQVSCF